MGLKDPSHNFSIQYYKEVICIKTFNLTRDPYDEKVFIFGKKNVTLEPGVTVLVGCNGYGKTSFIESIKTQLKKEGIHYVSYNNLTEGNTNSISKALFCNDFTFGATAFCSSEGERIMMNIERTAGRIGDYIRANPDQKEYFVLLDAIDSGFSIDNIVDVKKYLFNIIIEDCTSKGRDIYIIVSANEYEMCYNEKCFDTYKGKYRTFKSYTAYKNFILRTRTIKNNRRH